MTTNDLFDITLREIINSIQIKYIFLFLILFFLISILLFIFICYFVIKILELSFDDYNILFYQYNKQSKNILDLYGDYELTNIYLVRQPFGKLVTFFLNIFTFYNYEKQINESQDNFPYHTLLVCEVKLYNNMKKLLLVEKNNCINISENFLINKFQEIKKIKIDCKKYTLNQILNKTQKRIGNEKYFNWHMCKNNCQDFTKEILKSIGKYTKKNKEFIFRNKVMIIFSELIFNICNSSCVICNILEKYIFNCSLFI